MFVTTATVSFPPVCCHSGFQAVRQQGAQSGHRGFRKAAAQPKPEFLNCNAPNQPFATSPNRPGAAVGTPKNRAVQTAVNLSDARHTALYQSARSSAAPGYRERSLPGTGILTTLCGQMAAAKGFELGDDSCSAKAPLALQSLAARNRFKPDDRPYCRVVMTCARISQKE